MCVQWACSETSVLFLLLICLFLGYLIGHENIRGVMEIFEILLISGYLQDLLMYNWDEESLVGSLYFRSRKKSVGVFPPSLRNVGVLF